MTTVDADSARALRVTDLDAGYAERPVLHDISLAVAPGEMLAIVGPNGAGKSTLLRALNGALKPRSGNVEVFGRPIGAYDRRALARIIATVAQENSVAFQFSVMEIVLMGRAPHLGSFHLESPHDLAIADVALRRFNLVELAGRPIDELSGGERKRVFLARALAQEPRIILLDEPSAFLDMRHAVEIFACLSTLREQQGLCVVAALHDLNAAALYADRILMLKDGASVGYGSAEEVFTAGRLSEVYELEVTVGRNPATGMLLVYPGTVTSPRK
jgi:iron complex transport system ATP-binding protein